MSKFKNQKLELLFEFLLSKGWQPEEAMHKMEGVELYINKHGNFNKMEGVELYINKHGNFTAKFKDGTTNLFTVEHVPKFFEI